jgi:hypothetical protein
MDLLDLRAAVLQRIERHRRSLVRASGMERLALQAKLNDAEKELRGLFVTNMSTSAHWATGSQNYQTAMHA